jgi:hypothetical protein
MISTYQVVTLELWSHSLLELKMTLRSPMTMG